MSVRRLLLTTAQAADILGVTPATIRSWRCRGEVTPQSGTVRHPRWDLSELRQVQKRHEDTGRATPHHVLDLHVYLRNDWPRGSMP